MPVEIRPFHRSDRDQVTALVNAHMAAVIPGVSVSVQALLSSLEREPGEFIVDPWVEERTTLVAVQRDRVVAAAHLLRYGRHEQVGECYRGAGEMHWVLHWPSASFWPDAPTAGAALVAACVAQFERWQVSQMLADGALALGAYGIPEQWPHVRTTLEDAGFRHTGRTEVIYLARVDRLPKSQPLAGVNAQRSVGEAGARISAVRGDEVLGFIEVDTDHDGGSRLSRLDGWADVGNLVVREPHRRQGLGTWLVGQARQWLELAGVSRVLDYADDTDTQAHAFLTKVGFEVLTRTARGYERLPTTQDNQPGRTSPHS